MSVKRYLAMPFKLASTLRKMERRQQELLVQQELHYRDMMDILAGGKQLRHNHEVRLITHHPVAYDSPDHVHPLGTIQDNTRNQAFYQKCKQLYGETARFLDLGCSGGGLVFDFAINGHLAIGLEGSDLSQKSARANWRTIPNNLMTCDITKPFTLENIASQTTQHFEVISAWEVMEHIPKADVPQLLSNVREHLAPDGVFIGSISRDTKDPLHVTIESESWWTECFVQHGFTMHIGYKNGFEFGEFCRGIGGGLYDSHNYRTHPQAGFHFTAYHADKAA